MTEEWAVWAAWGEGTGVEPREWDWATSGAVEPVWRNLVNWPWGTEHSVILDRRAPGMGRRLLVRKGDRRQYLARVCCSPAYTLLLPHSTRSFHL